MTPAIHPRSVSDTGFLVWSLAGSLVTAVLLGLLGPFGSYLAMALPQRLPFYITTVGIIGGGISLLLFLLRRQYFQAGLPLWVTLGIALLAAVPGAHVVQFALTIWAPHVQAHVSWTDLLLQNLLLNPVIGAAYWIVYRSRRQAAAPKDAGRPPDAIAGTATPAYRLAAHPLADRLPPHLKDARLLALEAEDHYLRIHTDAGSALVLMRLSDAAERLGVAAGFQVHRSFWVAEDAVTGWQRADGRLQLHLAGGLAIPVSRSHRDAVMARLASRPVDNAG